MTEAEYLILIGNNISKFRRQKKLTSKELGYRCEIEKSNLIAIEKGRVNVTVQTLLKISLALDVDVKVFFEF